MTLEDSGGLQTNVYNKYSIAISFKVLNCEYILSKISYIVH